MVATLSSIAAVSAELRGHTGCYDYALAAAVGYRRAGINHIFALCQGPFAIAQRLGLLFHRQRFSCKRGFFNLQVDCFNQTGISGNFVAGAQQDDIADARCHALE